MLMYTYIYVAYICIWNDRKVHHVYLDRVNMYRSSYRPN